MTRLVLAIVAATLLSGCQQKQATDPFWGQTTVPPPATGSIGTPVITPGYTQPLPSQPVITPGTPLPSSGYPPTAPNLLPAPMSRASTIPGSVAPMPATSWPGGSGTPYSPGTSAMTAPLSSSPTPPHAPPSGYSSSGVPPVGSSGSPTTMPGSFPAATYPASPTSPMTSGGYVPSTGPSHGSYSPPSPTPAPTPAGSPPGASAPGYFPPGGYNYNNRSEATRPSSGGNWVTPSGVAAAPVSLDGAIVSAPPATTMPTGMNAGPSIVRIPTAGDGGSAATTSAEIPVAPMP